MHVAHTKRAIKGVINAMGVEPREKIGDVRNYYVTRIVGIAGIVRCLLETPIRIFVGEHATVGIR